MVTIPPQSVPMAAATVTFTLVQLSVMPIVVSRGTDSVGAVRSSTLMI